MPAGGMMHSAIGAGLGALVGATSPTPPIFDYKKEGVNFLTGYHDERKRDFDPIRLRLLDMAQGKGLTMSAAERSKYAAAEIARLRAAEKGIHMKVQQRNISAGLGAGGGMAQAGHLKADIAGLNAERGVLGQIASAEAAKRVDRQQRAMGMATDLYQQDTGRENAAIGAQWQSKFDRKMAGSVAHRALAGAAAGWSGAGPSAAAAEQQRGGRGNAWWYRDEG